MVRRLVAWVLLAGFIGSARGDALYDQVQAAYGRADNATAFLKCVEVIEARPVSPDAPRARYLMELLMAGKLRPPERRQVLEQLQSTRPWLAAFLGGLDAEAKTNWNQAASLTLEFIAGAPDDGWRKLATAQLCRQLPEAMACPADPATLVQAAIRLRQLTLRDCVDGVWSFAERIIAQNSRPEAARLRAEWRRLLLTSDRRSYLQNQSIEQIVMDYLAAGETNEVHQFAEEWISHRGNELTACTTVAGAIMKGGDSEFAYQLLRRTSEKRPAGERSELLKYFPEQQEILYQKFSETKSNDVAQMLAAVWRDGFLKAEVCERLMQEYYHFDLRQTPGDKPGWDLCIAPTFPFPNIQVEDRLTLYRNDKIEQSLGWSAFSWSSSTGTRASFGYRNFNNGDVLQCKVEVRQKQQWQTTLWTNKITLEGLKQ